MEHETDTAIRTLTILGHAIRIECTGTSHAWLQQLDELLPGDLKPTTTPSTVIDVTLTPQGEWSVGEGKIVTMPVDAADALREVEAQVYAYAARRSTMPLVLHAGAVTRGGSALVMPASSGSGKTTLTLALQAQSWLPLTDDICPLADHNGTWQAFPCQRCFHVSEPSLDAVGNTSDLLRGPVAGKDDYFRPVHWGEAAPVRWIIAPKYMPDAACSLVPLTQAEVTALLIAATFQRDDQTVRATWQLAMGLAVQARGFNLTYADVDDACAAIADGIR